MRYLKAFWKGFNDVAQEPLDSMQTIKEKLIQITLEFVSQDVLDDETNFDRSFIDIGIDSLDVFTIVLNVQEEFELEEISEEDMDGLDSLNEIVNYVYKERATRRLA